MIWKDIFYTIFLSQNPAQTSFWLAAAAACLQLFRFSYAMLQRCFAVKLQKCFVDEETENWKLYFRQCWAE